jgi:hypothetical protein
VTEERFEVYREHFEECVSHLAKQLNSKIPPRSKGRLEALKPIAEFCAVGPNAVSIWLSGNSIRIPVGLAEIRLKCLLDLNGYRIIEFERLSKVLRYVTELIGYGVVSAEEAAAYIGYHRTRDLYPALRGDEGRSASKEKEVKMFDLLKEKKQALEQKKKQALKLYSLEFLHSGISIAVRGQESAFTGQALVLAALAGLLPLIDEGSFEDLSATEQEYLKERFGSIIRQFSDKLDHLRACIFPEEGD